MMLENGYEYVTSHFTNNERTVCEILWKHPTAENEMVATTCEANPDTDSQWRELLTITDIDTIHENTYKYIREQDNIFKNQVISIAKERGLLYDVDSINTDMYKSLAKVIFDPFDEERDKEKLFMLKLQLFELEAIKNSPNRPLKAQLRKAPDILTAFQHAISLFKGDTTNTEDSSE